MSKATFTLDTCSWIQVSRISIPDEQLVSVYMSTDTSTKQCSTRGYKWIHVAVTTILSPIQDTCRQRQGIPVDTNCIWATCIRCKCGIIEPSSWSSSFLACTTKSAECHSQPAASWVGHSEPYWLLQSMWNCGTRGCFGLSSSMWSEGDGVRGNRTTHRENLWNVHCQLWLDIELELLTATWQSSGFMCRHLHFTFRKQIYNANRGQKRCLGRNWSRCSKAKCFLQRTSIILVVARQLWPQSSWPQNLGHNVANVDKTGGWAHFEAASDRCLDWNATKRYWWCHRPVAQASPYLYSGQWRTFGILSLTLETVKRLLALVNFVKIYR